MRERGLNALSGAKVWTDTPAEAAGKPNEGQATSAPLVSRWKQLGRSGRSGIREEAIPSPVSPTPPTPQSICFGGGHPLIKAMSSHSLKPTPHTLVLFIPPSLHQLWRVYLYMAVGSSILRSPPNAEASLFQMWVKSAHDPRLHIISISGMTPAPSINVQDHRLPRWALVSSSSKFKVEMIWFACACSGSRAGELARI